MLNKSETTSNPTDNFSDEYLHLHQKVKTLWAWGDTKSFVETVGDSVVSRKGGKLTSDEYMRIRISKILNLKYGVRDLRILKMMYDFVKHREKMLQTA